MIGYATLGTSDIERSVAYYDALLAVIGAEFIIEEGGYFIAWATSPEQPALSISVPFD